ncbi:TetR/AcrR family transcriptional regulator [Paenibacillus paeoniae]|uniref:TetR/AcrR family transcriptional regulator n=1 Tax=Paenibacillus paeoniae TaxID=2292705 RepID=A0A371PPJ3_9BACL|nr:TetR/AcrR family transcriptional regulator [Paenibacillus paeoniae]REK77747.1 TetR/AcrR family transcriptional regulator [Paenibacillus paeoniae]
MARSKEFDVETVLTKAMMLFWSQGYEKTSMQDLIESMGIHRRSLYDTYGNKQTLFLKALERYLERLKTRVPDMTDSSTPVKPIIRRLFELAIIREEDEPKGCLLINTAIEIAIHEENIGQLVRNQFEKNEKLLEALVKRGQSTGEISSQMDSAVLAHYLHNAWSGLRVTVKTTDDLEKLYSIVDSTLRLLD